MLTVPLQANNYPLNGVEHIEMWANGKREVVEAPFWPYFIVKEHGIEWANIDCTPRAERIMVKPITTKQPTKAIKYSFPMVNYIRSLNYGQLKQYEAKGTSPVVENHLRFLERVAIDDPAFFRKYANKQNKLLVFDIETLSVDGTFYTDIIAIAVSDGETIYYEDVSEGTTEKELLEWFIRLWKDLDADHIIGYNHKRFDLPRVFEACQRNGLTLDWVSRTGVSPELTDEYRLKEGIIRGRCVFDVWENVESDQTLMGMMKNDKLKTVARYFGIPAITEETSDTASLLAEPEKLRAYNESDVRITLAIFERYFHQSVTIANQIGFPFDEIVNPLGARKGIERTQKGRSKEGITRLIGTLVAGRGMVQRGFVEDGKNWERFPEIFAHRSEDDDDKGAVYQGAVVGLFKDGIMLPKGEVLAELYSPVLHSDYSGMYPSVQMEANISPETVSIVGYEPYDKSVWPDGLVRERTDDYVVFVIPDKNLMGDGRNAIIKVDQTFEGGFAEYLRELKKERGKVKKKYKAAKKAGNKRDEIKWYSVQYGLKVVGNACGYGSNVRGETRYGSLIVGILITGLARYMLESALEYMKEWEPDEREGIRQHMEEHISGRAAQVRA